MIARAVPSMEMVRLVSSGTEAAMSAIRLARGATGRDLLVKFDGCYHGHADSLLVKAGSGGATFGMPDSRGVPAALAALTATVAVQRRGGGPRPLPAARATRSPPSSWSPWPGTWAWCPRLPASWNSCARSRRATATVLIFDEVITGFRVACGGAQERYGVRPDLTCLGKIIGGGLPVGAYGGRRDLMSHVAPLGSVYQAGTLSGNPLAVAAGLATLRALRDGTAYGRLEALGAQLERGLRSREREGGDPARRQPGGFDADGVLLRGPGDRLRERAQRRTPGATPAGSTAMLERGVYLAPSQFEAAFVSLAHTEADLERAARAATEVLVGLG